MATTALVAKSNRFGSQYYLDGNVASVALDANISEDFTLPTGFGSLLIVSIGVIVGSLSGAYVAPAPAFDGPEFFIVSADATSRQDILGSVRYVNSGTASARPQLTASIDFQNSVLMRLGERIRIQMPVIAGAGVTGAVTCVVRGLRFQTA